MSTLMSMVGQQPAAIATTAKTLLEKADLKQIFLLPTEKTKDEYGRLELYLRDSLHIPAKMIEPPCCISTDIVNPRGSFLAWEAIREYLKRGDLDQPVYFDTSPGLNYQVALISYHLNKEDGFQALYADNKKLHNLKTGDFWDLAHIGFKELLDLYGLKDKNDKKLSSLDEPVDDDKKLGEPVNDVVIVGGKKEQLALIAACEKEGRFYGLYRIWKKIIPKEKGSPAEVIQKKKEEDVRIKQEARKLESILKAPDRINHLHPEFTVWVNDDTVARRLTAYGIKVISNSTDEIEEIRKEWTKLIGEKPAPDVPGINPAKDTKDNTLTPKNPRWTGNNLIVVLGSDPSATLQAIFAHKPKELIILWDCQSAWINVIVERIREWVDDIPAENITLYEWNLLDMNENVEYPDILQSKSDWFVNISPGTKLHSWHLPRLDVKGIYSLDNEHHEAVNILDDQADRYPYDMPPILLTAAMHQGTLAYEDLSFENKGWKIKGDTTVYDKRIYAGVAKDEIEQKKYFLRAMVNVIAKSINNSKTLAHIPFDPPWAQGKEIEVDRENYIKCKDVNSITNTMTFEVRLNGKTPLIGTVKAKPEGGFWLEEPVAGAFYAAGGRNVKDVRVGVKWPWLLSGMPSKHFRTEIDVVLLWKDHYICISCKTTIQQKDYEKVLAQTENEIMAEARAGFGRFAIPILMRGGISKKHEIQYAKNSLQNDGLLQIGLGLLNQPNILNELVELAIKEYQTLS